MKKNMGTFDRFIRFLVAVVFIAFYLMNITSGLWGIALMAISALFLFTSFFGVCPIYMLTGWSTAKKECKNDPIP